MVDETAIPGEFAERISVDSCRTTAIVVLGWLGGRSWSCHMVSLAIRSNAKSP